MTASASNGTQPSRWIDYMPLDEIRFATRNPKGHDLDGIGGSIDLHGMGELPLLDERTGLLVAGHGRVDALRARHARGGSPPEGLSTNDDGMWLMPVIRGWQSSSDAAAESYLIGSNEWTAVGGWADEQELAAMLVDLQRTDDALLSATGYDIERLDELMAALDDAAGSGGGSPGLNDPDDTPEPPAEPHSKPGDLWLLGPHRLLCGAAEEVGAHHRLLDGQRPNLLLMDPPYGMRLDTDYSTIKGSLKSLGRSRGTQGNRYEPVIGDDEDYDPRSILGMYQDVTEQFWWGADYYAEKIPDRADGSWLVWDKRKESQADAIGSEFELCWSRRRHKRRMLRHEWFGFLSSESPTEARNRVHPTQKPVALYTDILRQWGAENALVLDTYAGSGTTVLACHQLGMRAAVMEMSPAYCDVICRRYQEHTGTKPTRDGTPHDFTAGPMTT